MASSPTTTQKLRSPSKTTDKAIVIADVDADDNASELLTDQLEDLAFTTTGWAYEHGIVDREENAEITTLTPTSTNYGKQLQRWATQPEPFHPARPSIKSTDAERQPAEPMKGTIKCLLVGFIPPCEPADLTAWSSKPPSGKLFPHRVHYFTANSFQFPKVDP
jgi:hypothetical protein